MDEGHRNKIGAPGHCRGWQNKTDQEKLQYRYYFSPALLNEKDFAHSVCSHWDVENRRHWVLDVAVGEDARKTSRGHGANNLATLRHFPLNQLRREKTKKASIRRKQRLAAMDINYLEKVIQA